jgi:predicted Zn-dependent peptidase
VRILTESMPGALSVTIGFWVAVGSRDEVAAEDGADGSHAGSLGSTHFLEHLLFKGTPTRTAFDIAEAFDSVGGEHNAATAKEYTCYYAKIRDRDLEMSVRVMSDMVTSSLIDADEFETERGVILEELAMADDDPSDVAHEHLAQAVLGEHPLGRPIGGNAETIEAATRGAVVEHYRANYRPNDLVISAAGAVDHETLVAMVTRELEAAGWDLGLTAAPVARRSFARATLGASVALDTVERPIEQANIAIGFPGINFTDERRAVMSAMSGVLGGGMSSRLFQEVREKRGLAYSVYSFSSVYSDAGIFGMFSSASPSKAVEVTRVMKDEFLKLADSGVTASELARIKGQLSGASALALEDTDTRMSRLGRAEIGSGEFYDYDASMAMLDAVTGEDIHDLAGQIAQGPMSIVAVGKLNAAELEHLVEGARA